MTTWKKIKSELQRKITKLLSQMVPGVATGDNFCQVLSSATRQGQCRYTTRQQQQQHSVPTLAYVPYLIQQICYDIFFELNYVAVERGETIFLQVILQDEAPLRMFYLLQVGEMVVMRVVQTQRVFLSAK